MCVAQTGSGTERGQYRTRRVLRLRRVERDERAFNAISLVAAITGTSLETLVRVGRGSRRVCGARHLAMYLAHVAVGRQYLQVARLFGRDRSTVMSACAQIEDRRDDPAFDAYVTTLERLLNEDAEATEYADAA